MIFMITDNTRIQFYDDTVETIVTHRRLKVSKWLIRTERIHKCRLHRLIVGLDIEWRRHNHRSENNNPVATLQLCVGQRCLIFQLLHWPEDIFPNSLFRFLANPDYTFVGVGVHDHVEKLENDYGLQVGGRVVDLGDLAADVLGDKELKNASLRLLARVVLGKVVDKPSSVATSKWDQQRLSPDQVLYASVDAFVSSEIGRVLYDDY